MWNFSNGSNLQSLLVLLCYLNEYKIWSQLVGAKAFKSYRGYTKKVARVHMPCIGLKDKTFAGIYRIQFTGS